MCYIPHAAPGVTENRIRGGACASCASEIPAFFLFIDWSSNEGVRLLPGAARRRPRQGDLQTQCMRVRGRGVLRKGFCQKRHEVWPAAARRRPGRLGPADAHQPAGAHAPHALPGAGDEGGRRGAHHQRRLHRGPVPLPLRAHLAAMSCITHAEELLHADGVNVSDIWQDAVGFSAVGRCVCYSQKYLCMHA